MINKAPYGFEGESCRQVHLFLHVAKVCRCGEECTLINARVGGKPPFAGKACSGIGLGKNRPGPVIKVFEDEAVLVSVFPSCRQGEGVSSPSECGIKAFPDGCALPVVDVVFLGLNGNGVTAPVNSTITWWYKRDY